MAGETEVRPFQVDILNEAIADLQRRIAATRLPTKELVGDRSQGVQLATIQELARYWATDYDWRACEARLNALPQFKTEIDGVDIHFIHVKSPHQDALPLIITHGWPGSVIEMLGVVGPLTDPAAHADPPRTRSILSSRRCPATASPPNQLRSAGTRPHRANVGGADAPPRLHPLRRPRRRRGRLRHRCHGPAGTPRTGRHPPQPAPDGAGRPPRLPNPPRRNARRWKRSPRSAPSGTGYFIEQATRPQTIGYALTDSPLALAAWLLDHDTDAYYKIAAAFTGGQPSGGLTRDSVLDNITLYWFTGTGASAARAYWESGRAAAAAAGQAPPPVSVPVGFTTFPGEIFRAPRSWVQKAYPTLTYFNKASKGGHFAAWEEPELFATEIQAAFRSLR